MHTPSSARWAAFLKAAVVARLESGWTNRLNEPRPLLAALGGHQNAAERTLQLNSGRTSKGIYAATARDISSGAAAYPLKKHHLGIAVVQVFNDASLRCPIHS